MVKRRIRGVGTSNSDSPLNNYGYGADSDYWTNPRMFSMSNIFINGILSRNSIYMLKSGETFVLENYEDVEMTTRKIRLRYKNGIR